MGNQQSSKNKSLSEVINYVAANYILTQNFQDMERLADMKYCDDLVILTSKIIEKKLNHLEIEYLAQHLEKGVPIDKMTKEKLMYVNKNQLDDLDVKNKTTKRRMCIGIAKFYVKVANVFAAIVTTVNPVVTYTDLSGVKHEANILNKQNIPSDVKNKSTVKINLCSKRLNALINNNNYDMKSGEPIIVHPKFCNMNVNATTGSARNLKSEPGIPELEQLFNDKYDDDFGGFVGKSKNMANTYKNAVKKLYDAFASNKSSGDINKLSEIPLRDFHNSSGCSTSDGIYKKSFTGNVKDKLFVKYADNIKEMTKNIASNEKKLVGIIDELFTFDINPVTKRKEVVINSSLDENKLQNIVNKTRNYIIQLYSACEDDFLKGLDIFADIAMKHRADASKDQLEELEKTVEKTVEKPSVKPEEALGAPDQVVPVPLVESVEGEVGQAEAEGQVGQAEAKAEGQVGKAEDQLGQAEAKVEDQLAKAEGQLAKAEGQLAKAEGQVGQVVAKAEGQVGQVIAGAEDKLGQAEAGVKSAVTEKERQLQDIVSSIPEQIQIN